MLSRTTGDVVKSMATMVFNTDMCPMLPLVTSACTIISTSANTVASTFAQNYMMQQMKNARITLVEVKTKGHLPHLTAGKMVAKHISDVIHEWIARTEPLTSIPPSLLPSYDRLREEIRVLKEENMLLKRENEALKKPAIDETTKLATVSRPGGGSHESSPGSGGS
ncbi:unnamed protein product [Triticum turgidum subsp. durum]|uniref:Uncharacterized protein n=2 Tax=Triticum TaxID=4564 RepID=A0A9R1R229_TRITD|nr:unnamed protein product [Triticum turgidum subsp. durum]